MAAIAWIIRILFVLIAVRWLVSLLTGGNPRRRPAARRVERTGGTLVRDPHCGTYIARDRALTARAGGATMYFCSEACRGAYADASRAAS